MKLVIVINQQAATALGDLDLIDCAILDWLMTICNSRNERIAAERRQGKTWVNYHKLMNDMPLLGFSTKSAVSKRLKKLQQNGYITLHTHQQRTYIDITAKCDRLVTSKPLPHGNTAPKTVAYRQQNRFPTATNNTNKTENYKRSEKNIRENNNSNEGYKRAKARVLWLKTQPRTPFEIWLQQHEKIAT